jgi:hypothetical protein
MKMFKFLYEHEWNPYRGEYKKLNKTKITKDKQVYSKIKYKTDIQYRLKSSLELD